MKPRGHSVMMAHVDASADDVCFFPTWPWGFRAVGEIIRRIDPAARTAWECACGIGSGAFGLLDYFERVYQSDKFSYGQAVHFDFLGAEPEPFEADWIITNPPFDYPVEFIIAALRRARRGVAMLVRLNFLETVGREDVLYGPHGFDIMAPFVERLTIVRGRLDPDKGTAQAYVWLIFLKARRGQRRREGFTGEPIRAGTRVRLTRPEDLRFAVPPTRKWQGDRLHLGKGKWVRRDQLVILQRLAGHPNGTGEIAGAVPGPTLAALVQVGLVDRLPEDRIGGLRYGINAEGKGLLMEVGGQL